MAMNVTLVLKTTYRTGRESGERQTSAAGVKLVRAHWFLLLVGPIRKFFPCNPEHAAVIREARLQMQFFDHSQLSSIMLEPHVNNVLQPLQRVELVIIP